MHRKITNSMCLASGKNKGKMKFRKIVEGIKVCNYIAMSRYFLFINHCYINQNYITYSWRLISMTSLMNTKDNGEVALWEIIIRQEHLGQGKTHG